MDHSSKTLIFRPDQYSPCQDAHWPHTKPQDTHFSLCMLVCALCAHMPLTTKYGTLTPDLCYKPPNQSYLPKY